MARLIDADVACKGCIRYGTGLSCEDCVVKDAPTVDAVEVVRCRDCKRWERHTEVNRDYGSCRRYSSTMRYDDFCSYGERKDGDADA